MILSFQQLIARWMAAKAMEAVKKEILTPATDERTETRQLTCDDVVPVESDMPSDMPEPEIGFVFAMPMEAAGIVDRLKRSKTTKGDGRTFRTGLFADFPVAVIESGVGRDKAGRAVEALIDVFRPKRIVSAGYAGGLSKRLKRFAVCFPEVVVNEADGVVLDLSEAIPRLAEPPIGGKLALLTTDFVVASPKQKRLLGEKHDAELVDMETFAVADACRRRNVPLLAVRIILDTADEQLPDDVQRILKSVEKGGARLVGSVLGSLFQRPSAMIDLFSLKQRALEATDRLAKRIAAELHEK